MRAAGQAHHVGIDATVVVELLYAEREFRARGRAAKVAHEVGVTQAMDRFVQRPARGPAEEGGDGSGDAGDGADATGDFLNVNSGISQSGRHDCPFLLDGFTGLRQE